MCIITVLRGGDVRVSAVTYGLFTPGTTDGDDLLTVEELLLEALWTEEERGNTPHHLNAHFHIRYFGI